uniref:Uncharacterized protein n=1 Tax=Panagrolaimus superbus TaxID=310955 RepID=A0A914YDD5_9BILA
MLKLFGKDKQKKVEDISLGQSRSSSTNLLKPQINGNGQMPKQPKIAGLKAPSALPTMAPSTSKLQMMVSVGLW